MNRLHRPPRSGDHDEHSNGEEYDVHRHQSPPTLRSHSVPVIPHPHIRFHLDADDGCEESTNERKEVVEEWDGFGDDEPNGAGDQDTTAIGQ